MDQRFENEEETSVKNKKGNISADDISEKQFSSNLRHAGQEKIQQEDQEGYEISEQFIIEEKNTNNMIKKMQGYITFGFDDNYNFSGKSSESISSPDQEFSVWPKKYQQGQQSQQLRLYEVQDDDGSQKVKHSQSQFQRVKASEQGERKKSETLMNIYKLFEADCYIKEEKNSWKKVGFKISVTEFKFGPFGILLEKIGKIKIFPLSVEGMQKKHTLKITTKLGNQFFICMNRTKFFGEFPLSYAAFARLITKKLKVEGIFKATQWSMPCQLPYNIQNDQYSKGIFIHGRIFKQSAFLKKWEERYITIEKNGLHSYKQEIKTSKDKSVERIEVDQTFTIKKKTIKYIWTWFQTISEFQLRESSSKPEKLIKSEENTHIQKDNHFLLIKVMHEMGRKTEFAIPICDYGNKNSVSKNWLLGFYRLLL